MVSKWWANTINLFLMVGIYCVSMTIIYGDQFPAEIILALVMYGINFSWTNYLNEKQNR